MNISLPHIFSLMGHSSTRTRRRIRRNVIRMVHHQVNRVRDCEKVVCQKTSSKPEDILDLLNVEDIGSNSEGDESKSSCIICQEELWPEQYKSDPNSQPEGSDHLPVAIKKCGHQFHLQCIKQWVSEQPICPLCRVPVVVISGHQPQTPGSRMEVEEEASSLPGHESCGTIIINFFIAPGIQTLHDPLPGEPFKEFSFQTYLPNNTQGQDLLRLLKLAWNRGLLFRIGYNPVTQKMDCIVRNGIEMKTRRDGGPMKNGYPHDSYLDSLRCDLSEIGVK